MVYKGVVISESLNEPSLINKLKVYKAEISEEEYNIPNENRKARWHLYWVEVDENQIKRLSNEIKKGWYAHFWQDRNVRAIFKDKDFRFNFDKKKPWNEVISYGKSLGIPEYQLDFPIES